MTGHQIRQKFLDFFASRGHRIVRSSSLVPANDPTLLFANAGMNQFKDVFLGTEKRDYSRATSSQKCVRAGGKHNDLENVGYTRRHHTFFEMLGNFSFGDYFKKEAIAYAWELVTKEYALPKDRLYITVFREDDDAEELWQKVAGVPRDRIYRMDEKDNFWQMGETGPCGPCSEIHFDLGPAASELPAEDEHFPSESGRYVEIWNLVFMQYDRDTNGRLTPLPRPSIDTGLGLERMAAILQGKLSNYDTDLIFPIMQRAAELFGVAHGEDVIVDTALRIIADHSRAAEFLIHDNVVPANEGRGYVLRKIMRRAMRHARRIGVQEPFLYRLTGFVAELMKPAYPELMDSISRVARIVKDEEHRYATTFQVAEKIFHDEAKNVQGTLAGSVAFKLYDTYGLPLEEQQEMAREYGLAIDAEGFEAEMERQRTRARASWKGAERATIAPVYQELLAGGRTKFLGYDTLEADARVAGILVNQQPVDSAEAGTEVEIVLDRTPFYAEAGGQVGDQGTLTLAGAAEAAAEVRQTYAPVPGLTVHQAILRGTLRRGDEVHAKVNEDLRRSTMRNHTATHLLHAALRTVLGQHVKQAGSVVDPERLRFDFTHYAALDPAEVAEVERLMNEQVFRDQPVQTDQMELDQALTTGAMALFGEKYGEKVRVVSVPGFSKELCGGTHVRATGEIGLCKIVAEGSISAGVRRIEAVTGSGALETFRSTWSALSNAAGYVQSTVPGVVERVAQLVEERSALKKEIDHLKTKLAQAQSGGLESQAREIKGARVLAARVDGFDRSQLRALADSLRTKWKSAVIVLASVEDGNVSIVSAVTKDLTAKVHAGKLAGSVAQAVGGKGGGRPDMAEAGGKEPGKLGAALDQVYAGVDSML
ncbi:MAG TPA: alanine--tRNA ligase [Bryobacteraceae bacterium]